MEIKLNSLKLSNFMKFRDFSFIPRGHNATIVGANRTGKTTIASAFSYSLFGKDIHNNTEFSLKTKDKNGHIIEMVDHIVENSLSIDGEPLILKRNLQETRTKKNRKLTGHTTDFWIDNEPDVKKKDYESKIAEIISFDLFKLLTSVAAFAELPWKTRREQLFKICAGANEDALGKAEKAKKIVASKKREIEEKKAGIQPRVDEKERDLAALADYNRSEIQTKIDNLEKQIQDIRTNSTRAVLLKEKAELETKLSQVEADQAKKKQEATHRIHISINELQDDRTQTNHVFMQIGTDIDRQTAIIEAAETEINGLYADWDWITKEEPEIFDLCPTCGQAFPVEQTELIKAEFNLSQSKKKEEINRLGKIARGKKEKAMDEKIELEVDLKQEQIDIAKIEKDLNKKKAELETIETKGPSREQAKELVAIKHRIKEIEDLPSQQDQTYDIMGLEAELLIEKTKIAKLNTEKDIMARIEELKTEEKAMAAAIEKLEEDLSLSEQKLEKEARIVEGAVNEKFDLVQFQLFKEHLNTAVDPCCKILIDGNEIKHGTSTSEEIRAGLDIIRVLSKFYGVSCPIFCDRFESVSDPIPKMDCQIIRLVVDSGKENLEIILDK